MLHIILYIIIFYVHAILWKKLFLKIWKQVFDYSILPPVVLKDLICFPDGYLTCTNSNHWMNTFIYSFTALHNEQAINII